MNIKTAKVWLWGKLDFEIKVKMNCSVAKLNLKPKEITSLRKAGILTADDLMGTPASKLERIGVSPLHARGALEEFYGSHVDLAGDPR